MSDATTQPFELRFSALGRALFRSPIRAVTMPAMARRAAGEDVCMLAGGTPHPSLFPMVGLAVEAADIGVPAAPAAAATTTTAAPADAAQTVAAQQYMSGRGFAPLLARVTDSLLVPLHGHASGWEASLTTGNTDGLLKTLELLTEVGH